MRVSRLVSAKNWRYAIGEIALIVIGITIALGANSWYEQQQERRDEKLVLKQIEAALTDDLALFVKNLETLRRSEQEIVALLAQMESGEPYSGSMQPYFRSARLWRGINIRSAPYEALKNRGFELISDPMLRSKLVDFYAYHYPRLLAVSSNDRSYSMEHVNPYFWSHFRRTDDGDWIPIAYDKLRSDPYFANLVRGKLGRLRGFLLPRYEENINVIRDILAEIGASRANSD